MKVGDKVKVVRKFIPYSSFNWKCEMDSYIGNIYEIKKISIDGSRVCLKNWWFPIESLELITEPFNIIPDMVSNPPHYTSGGIECIDAIRSALTPEEFRGYCKGNVIKYIWREKLEGGNEDIKKAIVYAGWIK
jgi:hypothetical protein